MSEIARERLSRQHLTAPRLGSPEAVVAWLVGVQAQDEAGAAWSVGLRLPGSSLADVQGAVADGAIVRTWAMRGTLHVLAAGDVGWLVPLLAPGIIARNRRRYDQLGLDEGDFARSARAIEAELAGGACLTRADLGRVMERAGVAASGQRLPYLLQRASLEGLVCHGPPQEREATFVLRREWVPRETDPDRGDALAALARRYFAGHGPATWRDFGWWSGLPAGDVAVARDRIGSELERRAGDGAERWVIPGSGRTASAERVAHLLPPFDEFLLGYQDRNPSLAREHAKRVNAGGGMPRATVVVDGVVIGTWRRTVRSQRWEVALDLFRRVGADDRMLLDAAAERLAAFVGLPVALTGAAG